MAAWVQASVLPFINREGQAQLLKISLSCFPLLYNGHNTIGPTSGEKLFLYSLTQSTSDTRCMYVCVCFHNSTFHFSVEHRLDVLQFNSIMTLTARS